MSTVKAGLIDDHRWRPALTPFNHRPGPTWAERPCAYWKCGRPRTEHTRTVNEPLWGSRKLSS